MLSAGLDIPLSECVCVCVCVGGGGGNLALRKDCSGKERFPLSISVLRGQTTRVALGLAMAVSLAV